VAWSCLFLLAWLLARGELGRLTSTLARPALFGPLVASALLISCNWLVYVWSVTHNHVVESSLGYYINPLVNVVLGVLVLHERLNRAQWAAIALAAAGVIGLTLLAGRPPWIAFTLAITFSLYGLVRKLISVAPLPGLATETLLLVPVAVGYLAACEVTGSGAFGRASLAVILLLVGSGLVTAIPLLLFAYGARALPYSTVGVLQYIAPSLQLLTGVLLFHESFSPAMAAGFGAIWLGLLVYAADGVRQARRALRATQPAAA
jgi:chloramphenicol-sensitive protein RarD